RRGEGPAPEERRAVAHPRRRRLTRRLRQPRHVGPPLYQEGWARLFVRRAHVPGHGQDWPVLRHLGRKPSSREDPEWARDRGGRLDKRAPGGCQFLLGDGLVRFLKETVTPPASPPLPTPP